MMKAVLKMKQILTMNTQSYDTIDIVRNTTVEARVCRLHFMYYQSE